MHNQILYQNLQSKESRTKKQNKTKKKVHSNLNKLIDATYNEAFLFNNKISDLNNKREELIAFKTNDVSCDHVMYLQ